MHTWTENPINEIWKQLKFVSYKENCKNLLIGKIKSGRTLLFNPPDPSLDKKVTEISMCIQQGIEYFAAANKVSINTSPLLIYYGILSLAKALIVANNQNIFIDDIKYHGLSTRPSTPALESFRSNKNGWCIENEYAIVNGGVFNELNKTIDPNRLLPIQSIIRIKDCISSVPEVKEIYERFYQEHANSFHMYSELKEVNLDRNKIEFAIPPNEKVDILLAHIPQIATDFDTVENMHDIFPCFRSKNDIRLKDIGYFANYHSLIGGRYFVCGLNFEISGSRQSLVIDQQLLDYISLFILGEQVRYHQDLWCRLVQGEDSGALGVIEMYLEIVKRRYPNAILNNLFGENFSYGVPTG